MIDRVEKVAAITRFGYTIVAVAVIVLNIAFIVGIIIRISR
jgi:hypothetical protein